MSDTTPQPVSNGYRKYVKSKIRFNTFNTFNNVMSKRNHLAKLDRVSFKDLLKYNVIMPDVGHRVFATFQNYLHED